MINMTSSTHPRELIASELFGRVALLTRLIVRAMDGPMSRTEAGLLNALSDGPRRITELAELEGLAQPTMTLLVKRLAELGWVARERHASDGRVVLVRRTAAGARALDGFRARAAEVLNASLEQLRDEQLQALGDAVVALDALIGELQREPGR